MKDSIILNALWVYIASPLKMWSTDQQKGHDIPNVLVRNADFESPFSHTPNQNLPFNKVPRDFH
jgi:hypothetical protein